MIPRTRRGSRTSSPASERANRTTSLSEPWRHRRTCEEGGRGSEAKSCPPIVRPDSRSLCLHPNANIVKNSSHQDWKRTRVLRRWTLEARVFVPTGRFRSQKMVNNSNKFLVCARIPKLIRPVHPSGLLTVHHENADLNVSTLLCAPAVWYVRYRRAAVIDHDGQNHRGHGTTVNRGKTFIQQSTGSPYQRRARDTNRKST